MISMPKRLKEHLPWLAAAVLAALCLALFASLSRVKDELRRSETENADLREQLHVANLAPLLLGSGQAQPGLSDFELRRLQARGLRNPAFDLIQDLASRPDLIPAEAFFGGTMHIVTGQSFVLTDRWVLAGFEDGHVRGNLWLEYDVGQAGEITWRLLGWHMN